MRLSARTRLSYGWIAVVVAGLLTTAPARDTEARVDPLAAIKRQLHKPNMLIVLDTSGSMTGIPGGSFNDASEVGVDCEDGVNCRGSTAGGVCSISGRSCAADADCISGSCATGGARCTSDAQCVTTGSCALSGGTCAVDSDCPPQTAGACSATGAACNAATPCATVGRCAMTGRSCNNPGGACPAGTCAVDGSIDCNSNNDCPRASSGGTCSGGVNPPGGCIGSEDCPSLKRCLTGQTCRRDDDCPDIDRVCTNMTTRACSRNRDCPSGGECKRMDNICTGPENVCALPATTCTLRSGNSCQPVANSCNIASNTCTLGATNVCRPAPVGDLCNAGTATSGIVRMCRVAQTLCVRNSDCPNVGDSCGPPTSRSVIAKRTLQKIINENATIINLGLMTFYQNGYFPYFKLNSSGGSTTERRFFGPGRMEDRGCFNSAQGPSATCNYQGVMYTLAPTPNSQYEVNRGRGVKTLHDQNFCGKFCNVPGIGTGKWKGSYYVRTTSTGTLTTTKLVRPDYEGQTITVSGSQYRYFTPRDDYYNANVAPPITVANCGSSCSAQCGGRWDAQLAPFIDPDADEATAKRNALEMLSWMEPASQGGLVMYGGTPSGCTLQNDATNSPSSSAYHYMQQVKAIDTLPCRTNFVLFITDGEANGPGDTANGRTICDTPACSASDPVAAGCACRSVLAAYRLRKNLGVRTFVVGFGTDVFSGSARLVNENIAKAGGTDKGNDGVAPFAFTATNETELVTAVQGAIYEAVRGSYSTSQATASSGTQVTTGILSGHYALDARVDFPSWEGHLLAYDVTRDPPVLAWDAAAELEQMNWWERRVYLGSRSGSIVRVQINPVSKAVTNKDQLHALGLGENPNEAESIARFMLGDPSYRNPIQLGAIVNSAPIDVGHPGVSLLPGSREFFERHYNRPNLTYVGADDGMLHAFFTVDTNVGGAVHPAGSEAFAYVPPDMIPVWSKIYTQGGQVADPSQHIYGIANSPKVRNMCVRGCDRAETAEWKTVLTVASGFGGNEVVMLDITNPVSASGFSDPPVQPLWHTDSSALKAAYDEALGLTLSMPAFYFNKTDALDDNRIIFASGYPLPEAPAAQGKTIVVASANSGRIVERRTTTPVGGCAQDYTILADVATSRVFTRGERQQLLAGYVGDTWGTLWRYRENLPLSRVADFGCSAPLHFAPTVVQLDRDDPRNRAGEVFLVQVTNSSLDITTQGFVPSKMVIMKEVVDENGQLVLDTDFGTSGKVTLTVGNNQEICGVTDDLGNCLRAMPANARPSSTPLAIMRKAGDGFQAFTLWYAPDTNGCGKGTTYLTVHQLRGTEVSQIQGLQVANEPVTSPVVVGNKIFVLGSSGAVSLGNDVVSVLVAGPATPYDPYGDGRFRKLSWSELP